MKIVEQTLLSALKRLIRNERGAAAAEFTLVAVVLVYMFANIIDIGMYAYDKMELQNAGQALMEKIFVECPPNSTYTPITTKCNSSGGGPLTSDIENTAVQNTSLGTNVTISSITAAGATTTCIQGNSLKLCEGWFCVLTGGSLDTGTAISSTQPTCGNGNKAGDYVAATVSYTYTPVFSHFTVASLLATPITYKAWMRVN